MREVWREDEDILLAEAVLRHIREGSTLMSALDEVEKKLNRPAAECGFRWSAFVRHSYKNAINNAKKKREQLISK